MNSVTSTEDVQLRANELSTSLELWMVGATTSKQLFTFMFDNHQRK